MASAKNQSIVVDQLIREFASNWEKPPGRDRLFEYFATSLLIEPRLSIDQIERCNTDGGGDGQIDEAVLFVDDVPLMSDLDVQGIAIGAGHRLELVFVQSTVSDGISGTKFKDLSLTTLAAIDPESDFGPNSEYNPLLRAFVTRYRLLLERLKHVDYATRVRVLYVTRAARNRPHHTIAKRAEGLKESLVKEFGGNEHSVEFVAEPEIIAADRRGDTATHTLACKKSRVVEVEKDRSYLALPTLGELHSFLDQPHDIADEFFDDNVRDWQKGVNVNREIRESLYSNDGPFWWRNNGITILCDGLNFESGRFRIMRPRIVNGLQTSREIFNRFGGKRPPESVIDDRVIVRIVQANEPTTRDTIIRATNSQTPVTPEALRASSPIHMDIEVALRSVNIYYDRRKGYYSLKKVPAKDRMEMKFLAQAVLAIGLGKPDDARARPGDYFRDDDDHDEIFSESISLDSYIAAAQVQRRVDEELAEMNLAPGEFTNLHFHVAMVAAALQRGRAPDGLRGLTKVKANRLTRAEVRKGLTIARKAMRQEIARKERQPDAVSKSPEFRDRVLGALRYEIA